LDCILGIGLVQRLSGRPREFREMQAVVYDAARPDVDEARVVGDWKR